MDINNGNNTMVKDANTNENANENTNDEVIEVIEDINEIFGLKPMQTTIYELLSSILQKIENVKTSQS